MIPLKVDLPSARKPVVTASLIATCAGVFLWQRSLDAASSRQAVAALGAIPAVLLTDARLPADLQWLPRFASPITSMFLHGGWMHLLGNMLFLWIYGDNVEDALGHWRFLGLCPTPLHRIPSSAPAAPSPGCWAPTCCCFRGPAC
jgi:membrane associated rhomboid family serine protease